MQMMSVPNSVGGVDHGSWCQVQFASRQTSVKGAPGAELSKAEMIANLVAQHEQREPEPEPVVEIANARVDFLGNVSDAFNGEVILFSLKNFNATVKLQPGAPGIRILPNPELDSYEYSSFEELDKKIDGFGYYGGVRLLQATCKHFFTWCKEHDVELDMSSTGFTLSYDTTIPRQAGLSGSSAIVCAALRCLLRHYDVEIPVVEQPAFIQQTEHSLGINADLQDRVVQVFGGLMHLDFSDLDLVTSEGCGTYSALEPSRLPPLYLMYSAEGSKCSNEGEAIEQLQAEWRTGDLSVRESMQMMADCARQGRVALERWDVGSLANLMTRNFELKRSIIGAEAMGASNIRMVELAQAFGCAAKPCGSGGAVVVLCPRGKPQVEQLKEAAAAEGFHFLQAEVAPR